jgi:hypothetical protein
MVVNHSSNTQEKWQTENLYRFQKLNVTTKKDPYPLTFIDEVLNMVGGYETYSFLDGYSGYNQISIALNIDTRLHLLQSGGLLYGR